MLKFELMKKSSIKPCVAAAFGIALTSITAFPSTLVNSTSYNGHTYDLFDSLDISWQDAKAAAVADGGYLATLTDSSETTAVYGAFIGTGFFTANDGQQYQAWLGGYTTDSGFTTTNPSAWAWTTGEAWTAFDAGNFAIGEPNGDSSGLSINRFGTPKWNDESGRVGGYIVEHNPHNNVDNDVVTHAIPDSASTLALLSGSFALLGAFRRKFRS